MSTATIARPGLRATLARWLLGGIAVAFGIATVFIGGHVLWGGPEAREAAGKVVPFVLLFNFGVGFAYVAGGLASLLGSWWSIWLARGIAVSTLLVFAAFGVHVLVGGDHETRTLLAMLLRLGFWGAQALLLPRLFEKSRRA